MAAPPALETRSTRQWPRQLLGAQEHPSCPLPSSPLQALCLLSAAWAGCQQQQQQLWNDRHALNDFRMEEHHPSCTQSSACSGSPTFLFSPLPSCPLAGVHPAETHPKLPSCCLPLPRGWQQPVGTVPSPSCPLCGAGRWGSPAPPPRPGGLRGRAGRRGSDRGGRGCLCPGRFRSAPPSPGRGWSSSLCPRGLSSRCSSRQPPAPSACGRSGRTC